MKAAYFQTWFEALSASPKLFNFFLQKFIVGKKAFFFLFYHEADDKTGFQDLSHCNLMTPYGNIDPGQHRLG